MCTIDPGIKYNTPVTPVPGWLICWGKPPRNWTRAHTGKNNSADTAPPHGFWERRAQTSDFCWCPYKSKSRKDASKHSGCLLFCDTNETYVCLRFFMTLSWQRGLNMCHSSDWWQEAKALRKHNIDQSFPFSLPLHQDWVYNGFL